MQIARFPKINLSETSCVIGKILLSDEVPGKNPVGCKNLIRGQGALFPQLGFGKKGIIYKLLSSSTGILG